MLKTRQQLLVPVSKAESQVSRLTLLHHLYHKVSKQRAEHLQQIDYLARKSILHKFYISTCTICTCTDCTLLYLSRKIFLNYAPDKQQFQHYFSSKQILPEKLYLHYVILKNFLHYLLTRHFGHYVHFLCYAARKHFLHFLPGNYSYFMCNANTFPTKKNTFQRT